MTARHLTKLPNHQITSAVRYLRNLSMKMSFAVIVAAAAFSATFGMSAQQAPGGVGVQAAAQNARTEGAGAAARSELDRYCVSCHNARLKTGGLALDTVDPGDVGANAELWEKVARKVRTAMMPPPGRPAPSDTDRRAFVTSLESSLDRLAEAKPLPGRPLVHRLNRAEYANAIRDLLSLEIDPAPLLPADDSSAGFDNIADVLGLSPVLLESYLSAAGRISALAIGDPRTPPMGE